MDEEFGCVANVLGVYKFFCLINFSVLGSLLGCLKLSNFFWWQCHGRIPFLVTLLNFLQTVYLVYMNEDRGPRPSPEFVEWLMDLPVRWITDTMGGLTANQQKTAFGNGSCHFKRSLHCAVLHYVCNHAESGDHQLPRNGRRSSGTVRRPSLR